MLQETIDKVREARLLIEDAYAILDKLYDSISDLSVVGNPERYYLEKALGSIEECTDYMDSIERITTEEKRE